MPKLIREKRITVTLTKEQILWLEKQSTDTSLSYAAIVRLLINRAMIDRQKLI